MKGITGTFLDEISHDIPSANWGRKEWDADFKAMKQIGIDTVILIRAGFRDKATFNSKALNHYRPMRPVYLDLVDLFLELAHENSMDFYFGLYDSGKYWHEGNFQTEIEINRRFTEEAVTRYGTRQAFKGWYASHEINAYDDKQMAVYTGLASHLKELKDMPILMSPYVRGRKQFDHPITPEEHESQWKRVFGALSGLLDIVAFQDGQVDFHELQEFMEINKKLADSFGFRSWSNIESFERGMPINFLPIAWSNLRYKMEIAEKIGMEKLITFEFSHFMSPHSMYPSAHNLYKRYLEHFLRDSNISHG